MATLSTWFSFGTVGMAVGTLALAYGFTLIDEDHHRRYSILVAVPLIAVVAYGLMALGISSISTRGGESVYVLRYLDWLLTTPLHVLYLGLLAGAAMGTIYRSIGLMALTIVLGFAGAVLDGIFGWLLYLLGAAAFVGVIYYAMYDFDDAVKQTDDSTVALYRKLRAFLIVLWLIYPVIWILAPVGLGLMEIETSALVISYLDIVSKVGFGLIALSGQLVASETTDSAGVTAD